MERRDRSLEALSRLNYIDSIEDESIKAHSIEKWVNDYLSSQSIEDFDLVLDDMKVLLELLYKNMNFLKVHRTYIKTQLNSSDKIKEFLK